jgi:predicted RNA binding protein YcfA (HicA-like mRNA interferase family)
MEKQHLEELDEANDELTLQFTVRSYEELKNNTYKKADKYLCIDEAGIVMPLDENFDPGMIENQLHAWLSKPKLITRGVVYKDRVVIAKLKRLNCILMPHKGTSHYQFSKPDGSGKVTVLTP